MKPMIHPDERIDRLSARGLRIIQSSEVFSFSQDAVLLAHFARIPKHGTIVDLCAGNGAVGLLLSERTLATIHAVEIQERLADMALRSIQLNNLTEQFFVHPMPLADLRTQWSHSSVDSIVCNPPYFKERPTSKKNENPHFTLARHELTTNLTEVCAISSFLLKDKGKLTLVHRPERFLDILHALKAVNLVPKRLQFIYPKADRPANMLLIEAIKNGKPDGLVIEHPFVVYDENNNYLPEMRQILHGE